MSVHVECPGCRQKNSLRNKRCTCGRDLDRAKRAGRIRYWIHYRIPVERPDGAIEMRQRCELAARSLPEARDVEAERRLQKRENGVFKVLPFLPSRRKTFPEAPAAIANVPNLERFVAMELLSCVYFLCLKGTVVYIGQSVELPQRIATHKKQKIFDSVYFVAVPKAMLDKVERHYIQTLKPRLNSIRGALSSPVG
jgi:hypothetical protein